MPPLTKEPLLRKCDKIGLAAAIALLAVTVLGSVALAETPTMSAGFVSDLQMRGFNPQPEPPPSNGFVSGAAMRGFNPQPEPPVSAVSLNPQPEPPSQTKSAKR